MYKRPKIKYQQFSDLDMRFCELLVLQILLHSTENLNEFRHEGMENSCRVFGGPREIRAQSEPKSWISFSMAIAKPVRALALASVVLVCYLVFTIFKKPPEIHDSPNLEQGLPDEPMLKGKQTSSTFPSSHFY